MKNNFRLLHVNFNTLKILKSFYTLEFLYQNQIKNRNIKILYRKSNTNNFELYGYDNKLKYISKKLNKKSLIFIFKLIDKMPLRKYDNEIRVLDKSLKTLCHLPKSTSTSHCFSDSTHQTCCMLGNKAREYSNKSGNPIGKIAEKMFYKYYNKYPTKNDLTPWCTCIGSNVCSYYADKFKDDTHIKFINNPNNKVIAYDFKNNCEEKIKNKFNYQSHLTPGVKKFNKTTNELCKYKKYKYI